MTLAASLSQNLSGTATIPGDKSISHRALMFGALAVGETKITGLLEGEDVLSTAAALRAMGAQIHQDGPGAWRTYGVGVGGLMEPQTELNMGNSGTSTRLLLGLMATSPITATLIGDASLSKRPMGRVITPLEAIGARFVTREGGRLPLTMTGAALARPLIYKLPVASAQVKSAILLAGLNAPGRTTVIEPVATRDHTERMLAAFGIDLSIEDTEDGRAISLMGEQELKPTPIVVPRDPSSAAFPVIAALITEGSKISVPGILLNPGRIGLYQTLKEMGAKIAIENERIEGGEPVGDLVVEHGPLKAVTVPAERAPSMIDEYPVLFAAAAVAEGRTLARGLEELRVKESDRLAVMAEGLSACGVKVEEFDDGIAIHGTAGAPVPGGATIKTHLDHRIAMAFLTLGLGAQNPIIIDDAAPIETSFPNFVPLMAGLGAVFQSS